MGGSEDRTDHVATVAAPAARAGEPVWLAPAPRLRRPPVLGVRLVGVGLLVTVLVTLLAVASRPSAFTRGAIGTRPAAAVGIVHTVILLAVIADLVVLGVILYVLRPRGRRKRSDELDHYVPEPPPVHWAWKLLATILPFLILAGLVLILWVVHPPGLTSHVGPVAPVTSGTPHPGRPGSSTGGSVDFTWAELIAAAVLAAVAAVSIIWLARARHVVPPERARLAQTLAAVVDDSLEDVRNEGAPRQAVIRAYATMERLLAAHGFPRRAFEAPLEYLARVFGNLNADADALRTLTELFELAKFSHHDINRAMKEQAVSALTTIRDGLRAGA